MNSMGGRRGQEPWLRRPVVPDRPGIGERQIILNKMPLAAAKTAANVCDRNGVPTLFDPLPDTRNGLADVRKPEVMQLNLIAGVPCLLKEANVSARSMCSPAQTSDQAERSRETRTTAGAPP